MALIVVESPTKARTFNYLLKDSKEKFFVYATMGHFRDLPKSTIGINYDKSFLPDYEIVKNKEKIVAQEKESAREIDN